MISTWLQQHYEFVVTTIVAVVAAIIGWRQLVKKNPNPRTDTSVTQSGVGQGVIGQIGVARDIHIHTAPPPVEKKRIVAQNDFAGISLQRQNIGLIPGSNVKTVRVFGTIENRSPSVRIREYSCTLSVPECCLSFNNAVYPAEIKSTVPGYRKFRHTEKNHTGVSIHPGDRLQVISVDVAVGHLSSEDQEKCREVELFAEAVADGEAFHIQMTIGSLMGE